MKTVNPQGLPLADYRKLIPFQQNLKDLDTAEYNKLLASIKKHGFFVPAFVWKNGGKLYILDSHQRHRILMHEEIKFENTGYEIPYVEIAAETEKEAKEKLLLLASQYGHVTREGLDEFAALAEIELDEIDYHFDAIVDFEPSGEPDPEPEKKEPSKEKRFTIDDLKRERDAFNLTGRLENGFVDYLATKYE